MDGCLVSRLVITGSYPIVSKKVIRLVPLGPGHMPLRSYTETELDEPRHDKETEMTACEQPSSNHTKCALLTAFRRLAQR